MSQILWRNIIDPTIIYEKFSRPKCSQALPSCEGGLSSASPEPHQDDEFTIGDVYRNALDYFHRAERFAQIADDH